VAGFQSFRFIFFFSAAVGELLRRGFGIISSQKERWIVLGEVAYRRTKLGRKDRADGIRELRMLRGARRMRCMVVDFTILHVWWNILE
jgi:hypothetical protein